MLADTDSIRALGRAGCAQASELAGIATALSSLPLTSAAPMFGPVGASFLAALGDAAAQTSRAVTALHDSVAAGGATADASASSYDEAERRVGQLLAGPAADLGV